MPTLDWHTDPATTQSKADGVAAQLTSDIIIIRTMRRLLVSVTLVLLMGAPTLQLRCAIACAPRAAATSLDQCHQDESGRTPLVLAAPHDCRQHSSSPAITEVGRPDSKDMKATLPDSSSAAAAPALGLRVLSLSFVHAPPRSSDPHLTLPLRR